MSKKRAFEGYGQQNKNKRDFSYGKVNQGNRIDNNLNEDGAEVPTYKMTNTPDKKMMVREAIKLQMQISFPEIGRELRTNKLSKYASGPAIPEEEYTAPLPLGLGPRPLANYQRYDANVEGLRKRWIIEQGNYVKSVGDANAANAKDDDTKDSDSTIIKSSNSKKEDTLSDSMLLKRSELLKNSAFKNFTSFQQNRIR